MKISIGADHRGFQLKTKIMQYFDQHEWLDVGTHSEQRTDYPIYAKLVCQDIQSNEAERGILLCGSGVGICIAANRFKGVYAALCWNSDVARMAVEDDGANVLVLPADFVSEEQAISIIKAWLQSTFKGGLYQRRLEMIDDE